MFELLKCSVCLFSPLELLVPKEGCERLSYDSIVFDKFPLVVS